MFTSKQRSNLNSLAQTIAPVAQVGKNGITDGFIAGLSDALEARELIKITILNNSGEEAKEVCGIIAEKLGAEVVSTIGHKVILYRRSNKKGIEHIKF